MGSFEANARHIQAVVSVSNSDHSVIENSRRAVRVVINAARVHLESPARRVDADGSWAESAHLLLEVLLIALRHVDESLDVLDTLGRIERARALNGLVRVIGVEHELAALVVDDVRVGA